MAQATQFKLDATKPFYALAGTRPAWQLLPEEERMRNGLGLDALAARREWADRAPHERAAVLLKAAQVKAALMNTADATLAKLETPGFLDRLWRRPGAFFALMFLGLLYASLPFVEIIAPCRPASARVRSNWWAIEVVRRIWPSPKPLPCRRSM